MTCIRLHIIAIACIGASSFGWAGEWPQFCGPQSNGVSVDQQLAPAWSADSNLGWTSKVPGTGWSSPAMSDDGIVFRATEQIYFVKN